MKLIKDCIYRLINVPEVCLKFIDTFEFQRLRHIKQLGFVHYVYPSAVHTRFEHSLGVMHLSGVMVDILDSTSGISSDLRQSVEITPREKDMVQVAGLLHDVGHVGGSHFIDYILAENGMEEHEERSIKILKRINDRVKVFSLEEIDTIAHMIRGEVQVGHKPFLFEIVSNSLTGLDVDRFDYLQRDLYHTGVGSYQPDYLLQCARVENGHIVFLEKAREEVKRLYETRRQMFSQVYRHKTILSLEVLVRECVKELNLLDFWSEDEWLNFDDVEFIGRLKKVKRFSDAIYTREWGRNKIVNRFEHCSLTDEESIKVQLEKVVFV